MSMDFIIVTVVAVLFGAHFSVANGQVYLSLGETTITTNNTEIFISHIGEDILGGLPSLTCHTDLTACCRNIDTVDGMAAGEWYYPNGSIVKRPRDARAARDPFYRIRNAAQVARLARRISFYLQSPTGSYCCVIPTTGGEMTFCANLVVCPSLTLTNGMISYSDPTLGVGSIASHTCDSEHILSLKYMQRRVCQSNGIWTGLAPTCEATCSDLNMPANGEITYSSGSIDSRPEGTVATYFCDNGYTLTGDSPRTCDNDRIWNGTDSTCTLISCGRPPEVSNAAHTTPSKTTFGGTVTYICFGGYEIPGGAMIITATCQGNGIWGPLPSCQAITCTSPPFISNGSPRTPTSAEFGGTVKYTCNTGYEITHGVSMATATCQLDRIWGPLPMCIGVSCGSPPTIDNGSRTFSDTLYQDIATYSCNTGYQLSGSPTVTCQADRTWSALPTCIATCPDLTLTNGVISYIPNTTPRLEGTVATHSCDTGYELSGGTVRTCQSDRMWSGGKISCQPIFCGNPPSIANGNWLVSGKRYQDIATYSCDTGYQLSGPTTVTCQASGSWSNGPTCRAICPTLALTNGRISYSPNTTPRLEGSVATHSCDIGYELSGGTVRTCQSDRTWSGGSITCEAVSCDSPPSISNGSPGTPTSTTFGGTVTYSCNPGYNLTGCTVAECLSNGRWSCDPPFCADNRMIQLKVGPARHCEEWTEERVELMFKFMNGSIFKAIQSSGHVIPKENVQPGYFSCYRSTTETTYRTTITGTERVSAVDYAALIQQWVDSGVTTRVLWYVIKFDKTCPVSISSMDDDECE